MLKRFIILIVIGAATGALTKAGAYVGLLELEASATAFLVTVIGAGIVFLDKLGGKFDNA